MDKVAKAKLAVIDAALGICALDEAELLQRLEKLYWTGFKAGNESGGRDEHCDAPTL